MGMFKKDSVDSIVSVFTKTVSKLKNLESKELDRVEKYTIQIEELEAKVDASMDEIAKAQRVIEKLDKMFS